MPSALSRLRLWLGFSALLTIAVVAGFYGYARYRVHRALREMPAKLGVNIQQNTEGFTYSQSARGRTIFSITASNAVRYKQGSKAELHNVKIVSYGRAADRLDQISGDDFEYDAQSGDIAAKGAVAIELQAAQPGTSGPGGNGKKIGSAVHLDASGLTFNKNTGLARTADKVTFQLPQASGSAVGAVYDSKQNTLVLNSDLHLRTTGPKPIDLHAAGAVFEQGSQQITVTGFQAESGIRHVEARRAVLHLRDDNTVESVDASDGVTARILGARSAEVHATNANFILGPKNEVISGRLNGGVTWETAGATASKGQAGHVLLAFGQSSQLKSVQLRENVDLLQPIAPNANQSTPSGPAPAGNEFRGDGLDLQIAGGSHLQQARSVGLAQIILTGATTASSQSPSATAKGKTVITASRFDARFTADNQLSTLSGDAPVKIVASAPGQTDRVSQSHDLLATFAKGKTAALQDVIQTGNVQIEEGQRHATADRATYSQSSDAVTLSGNVRYADASSGSSLSSNTLTLNRAVGETVATGDVKTTYAEESKGQAAGAMLSPTQPVHVTAEQMLQRNSTGIARYSGNARLWQGGNIIQAPEMQFSRADRTLEAKGQASERVSTVFVQVGKNGKPVPAEVSADHLYYDDPQRRATFDGSVVVRTADSTLRAGKAVVLLRPQSGVAKTTKNPQSGSQSQVQTIDATGNILLQQLGRRATGTRLVYTSDEDKFVLTGSPGSPPSIFDAEHGQVTGVSLTFFNRDDKVLVDSSNSTSITQTRLKK